MVMKKKIDIPKLQIVYFEDDMVTNAIDPSGPAGDETGMEDPINP